MQFILYILSNYIVFFTGLKNIHKLTSIGSVDLRIEMSSFGGSNKYAEYKLVC